MVMLLKVLPQASMSALCRFSALAAGVEGSARLMFSETVVGSSVMLPVPIKELFPPFEKVI